MDFPIRKDDKGQLLYVDVWEFVECCLRNGILKRIEMDGEWFIPVYREASPDHPEKYPEGWYLQTKDAIIQELLWDEEGIGILLNALEEKGVQFVPSFDVNLFQMLRDFPVNEEEYENE